MPNAVHETSAVTATVFAKTFQPDPPGAIISEEPERARGTPRSSHVTIVPRGRPSHLWYAYYLKHRERVTAARWLAMCLPTAGLSRTEKRKNT
jgi:hypothetical protein